MKTYAALALSALTALSMTACNIKMDDAAKPLNNDPVVTEKNYTDYTADLKDSEMRLERVGRRFVAAPDSSGRMAEQFDDAFYAQTRRQINPNPSAREELSILTKESTELDTYQGRAKQFVNAFPDKIVIQKPDGTTSTLTDEHAKLRAQAAKRLTIVVAKKTELAPTIDKLEKEVNPPPAQ